MWIVYLIDTYWVGGKLCPFHFCWNHGLNICKEHLLTIKALENFLEDSKIMFGHQNN